MRLRVKNVDQIHACSHRTTNKKIFDLLISKDVSRQTIVDVGAGEGYLVSRLGEYLKERYSVDPSRALRACDLYPEQFKYGEVACDRIDAELNLPYQDNSFDSVSCIEVIEHVESQFHLIQELFRIAKPGGRVIVTTPNILNINSRIRFLHSGFGLLFNPLNLRMKDPIRLGGHIHPVSFYYLAYMFYRCGFTKVDLHYDKKKRSAILWALALFPLIYVGHLGFRSHVKRKNPAVYEENREIIGRINNLGTLTSRSVIVEGFK
jgi:SAM-dependent methyltransferase